MKHPLAALLCLLLAAPLPATPAATPGPKYTDGKLQLPENYREWVFLSAGFDMSYKMQAVPGHHAFDNVFAEPSAYREFLNSGTWPDKTVLVLEIRGAQDKGSINKSGNFQGEQVMALEVHVKDAARFEDQWAFFAFDKAAPAAMIARSEECYACHAEHAAVDRTFVQFYPTLLPIARHKGTLSPKYLAAPH